MTPEDRDTVLATADVEANIPAPANLGTPGCLLFLGSLGLFALVPRLAVFWPPLGSGAVEFLAFAIVVLGIFAGLALFFFLGSGRAERRARDRAAAALELLATRFGELPRVEALQAAVRLVSNGVHSGKSGTRATIDPNSARGALGDALPLVQAVETLLVQERRARPFFPEVT